MLGPDTPDDDFMKYVLAGVVWAICVGFMVLSQMA